MNLKRHHLLVELTTIFILSSLSNGQTGIQSTTPHTSSSDDVSDTGGAWDGDPPDPHTSNAFDTSQSNFIVPGISFESSQTDPTSGRTVDPSLPPLSVGGKERSGYFQSQALVELPYVLPIEGYTSISFRTCSYGTIFKQIGSENDFIQLDLTEEGTLNLTLSRLGRFHSTVIANLGLNDNKWHTVSLKYELGSLILAVDNVTEEVANTTGEFSDFLQLNLSTTNPSFIIGGSFEGCILEGSNTQISSPEARYTLVDWSSCPLPVGRNCSGYKSDPCFSRPCRNRGTCSPDGENFSCFCYSRFNGSTCELDQGSLCNPDRTENLCENEGVCQEDLLRNSTFCMCPNGFTGDKCQDLAVCDHNPCENNGTCSLSEFGSHQCSCPSGFTGDYCQEYVGHCSLEPCLHGGLCTDLVNSFRCDCQNTGYRGDLCEVNIDECFEDSPCASGSTCFDLYGSFECACPQGYGGSLCDVDLDECASNPCLNDGFCTQEINAFTCDCLFGFEGVRCETNIDDCYDVFCPNNSICIDHVNDYVCECKPGYTGSFTDCVMVDGCDPSPCFNNGSCFPDDRGNFYCICPVGFTGDTCDENIDECRGVYCQNGGTCHDGNNNYTCLCAPGYAGPDCQEMIDGCDQDSCVHATNCTTVFDDYVCECESGWTGKNCDIFIDQCSSSPCQNNATCVNGPSQFSCSCKPGFQGILCDVDIDDCLSQPCFNGGTCADGVTNYTCLCTEAFMGRQCQDDFDACVTEPCANGATCATFNGIRECRCALGYEGLDCDVNMDDCYSIICDGGKVCFDLVNTYECRCPVGFQGHNCLTEIDECLMNPCQNNGTCHDGIGNFTCDCQSGFTGQMCEEDINECDLYDPCNTGICVNNDGSYRCYCEPGFTGTYCTVDINECLSTPCENGGTCLDQVNKYQCLCVPGFTGMECQIDIDECASQPCQNNGSCIDGINSFTCNCIPGFTDSVCSTNIDECQSNPCQNEGQCKDGINMYDCDCYDTGFNGTHCELNIDDCEQNRCAHGSNCTDLIKDYHCSCYGGYTGKNCEEDIMECSSGPCENEGDCFEYSNRSFYENGIFDSYNFSYATAEGFFCQCQPGFTGDNCEINIDECASSPCQYGECHDGINSYHCQCLPGYEGTHCETEINECERFLPCVHGTCTDKIADYECVCADLYGGKNCSVQLLGCVDVECESGGTCVPMLFNEVVHQFRCDCVPGFTGRTCEYATTVSMNGASYLKYNSYFDTIASYELLLTFRTTLPNVFLAIGENADKYFTLVLHDGKIKLKSSLLNRYDGIYSGSGLNDGEWHRVRMAVNETHAFLASNNESSEHALSNPSTNVSFPTTYLGGVAPNLKILAEEPFYTGCLRDIRIDDEDIFPSLFDESNGTENYFTNTRIVAGCPREAQCQPNPCRNAGQCLDLWSSYQCHCKRPYLGNTCSMSFTPATFGNEDFIEDSLATVEIPVDLRPSYREISNVSMVIRTRQSSGIIFYLGSSLEFAINLEDPGLTYVMAQLTNGMVVVRLRLGGEEQVLHVPQPHIDDGDSHLLQVDRDGQHLLVTIDEELRLNETLSEFGNLSTEFLYLGGIPDIDNAARRFRRQLGITNIPEPVSTHFKGVIQDVRLSSGSVNTRYVQLYPLIIDPTENFDVTILDSMINSTDLNNVLNGTVSDDSCSPNPCLQEGLCSITFNDFECNCPTGFKGKVCDELEYCAMFNCPEGATCQNLIDGYECLSDATFNGKNSSLIYEAQNIGIQVPTFIKFALKYRSRLGGILMSAGAQEGSLWVGIGEGSVVVQQTNQSTQSTLKTHFSSQDLLDGLWHYLWIEFDPQGMRVSLDNITLINTDMDDGVIIDFDHIIKSSGIQVGSLPEGINLRSGSPLEDNNFVTVEGGTSSPPIEQYFRGCMRDVRVQSILLPFYPQYVLLNDTSQNKFIRKEELGTSLGCTVCFNYECQNEGFCSDPSDTYTCSCPAGFEGSVCQFNIDECVGNNCTNEAVCEDGINSYTCNCVAGYEGQYCESDINECLSNPCQNGGTCEDQLANFACECLEDYIGTTCNDLKVKNCSNDQCQNGGVCENILNDAGIADNYSCECPFSYDGYNCDMEIDFCNLRKVSCQRGTCVLTHRSEGWMCQCEAGFEGEFCEQETDECAAEPCQNGGECVDKHLGYDCQCPRGWTGEMCEVDVDECKDIRNLCNHGFCVNRPGSYTCDCKRSHCGQHCYLRNPCFENDVLNCTQGECMEGCDESSNQTDASCSCFDGWEGEFCTDAVHALSAEALTIIIGVVVGLMLIVAIVGLVVFFMMAKKKRETSGTYSPSKQEYINPRVEMGNLMKPPPEERLI